MLENMLCKSKNSILAGVVGISIVKLYLKIAQTNVHKRTRFTCNLLWNMQCTIAQKR